MALAPNETQDALNVTSIGRMLMKRHGIVTATTLATAAVYIFWSDATQRLLVHRGDVLYALDPAAAWASTTVIASLGGTAKVACVDFNGLVVIHTFSGVYTWTGSGAATLRLSASLPIGSIATWQNKVWATNINKIYWCAAGDATTWNTATDFVTIREPDDTGIEAMGVGNGMDVVGRDGLLVWKRNSIHRIIDSETGEYLTLVTEPGGGCIGHEAIGAYGGVVYYQNENGMYRLLGDVPERIDGPIAPAGSYSWSVDYRQNCVFVSGGRVFFSRGSSTTIWEYLPDTGAWWRHSLYTGTVYRFVLSASARVGGTSSSGVTYVLDNGGQTILTWYPWTRYSAATDYASVAFPSSYASPWMSFGLDKARVRRAVVEGWGESVALSRKSDYQAALTSLNTDFDFPATSGSVFSGIAEQWDIGVQHALSLYFAHSATGAAAGPQARSTLDPVNQYVGSFGVNAIRLDYVDLGRS